MQCSEDAQKTDELLACLSQPMLQELEYDSSKLNQKVAHKNWDKGKSQELGRCQEPRKSL